MNTNSEAMREYGPFASAADAINALGNMGLDANTFRIFEAIQGEWRAIEKAKGNPGPDVFEGKAGKMPANAMPKDVKAPAKAKGKAKIDRQNTPEEKAEAKANAKEALGKAKAPDAKGKGKKGADARIAAQGDLKAKPKAKEAKGEAKGVQSKWRPLADRKWIGVWAEWKEKAEKGILPDVGSSKLDKLQQRSAKFYGFNSAGSPYFAADTHKSWEKKLHALCALIRAKDLKGLKAFEVEEKSSTRDAIAKMRDLAIGALMAKEAKPAKNGKAKEAPADAPAEMPAQE